MHLHSKGLTFSTFMELLDILKLALYHGPITSKSISSIHACLYALLGAQRFPADDTSSDISKASKLFSSLNQQVDVKHTQDATVYIPHDATTKPQRHLCRHHLSSAISRVPC